MPLFQAAVPRKNIVADVRQTTSEEVSLFQTAVPRSQPQKNIVADVGKIQEIPSTTSDKPLLDQTPAAASAAQSFV